MHTVEELEEEPDTGESGYVKIQIFLCEESLCSWTGIKTIDEGHSTGGAQVE